MADPAGVTDCAQHVLTAQFQDTYRDKNPYWSETQDASATVTFTRIHKAQMKRTWWFHPSYTQNPVDGCG